tara:strand:- start:25992 stop:26255 length:264 start_codon:yes stop_codon:yes gene_type:complete
MQQHHDLLRLVLDQGSDRADRTGTGTRSLFAHLMRFDLSAGTDNQQTASSAASSTSARPASFSASAWLPKSGLVSRLCLSIWPVKVF